MHIRCCVVDCFVHWFNHRNGIIRVPFGGGILILSREYQGLERRGWVGWFKGNLKRVIGSDKYASFRLDPSIGG
jgi:hypothetical protein